MLWLVTATSLCCKDYLLHLRIKHLLVLHLLVLLLHHAWLRAYYLNQFVWGG